LKVKRHCGGTCHLHLQGQRISQARNHREADSKQEALHNEKGNANNILGGKPHLKKLIG
jgi:hypothetical protein